MKSEHINALGICALLVSSIIWSRACVQNVAADDNAQLICAKARGRWVSPFGPGSGWCEPEERKP